MTTLPERLLEMCRTPDGHDLPDHAEPWGADVATLREAATALQSSGGEVVVPSGEEFRLLMGEMDTEQVCIAQAAFRMGARAVLASPAQPSGFVLVPVEPTEEFRRIFGFMGLSGFSACYAEMLTAAQSAPSPSAAPQAGEV